MTEYINEAQAKSIEEIIEAALSEAKTTIASQVEALVKYARPDNPFKIGDEVIVSEDAKCLNRRGQAIGGVYFAGEVRGTVIDPGYDGEVTDEEGNLLVRAIEGGMEQFVAPQFLSAAPAYKDGDYVTGTHFGGKRYSGILLPKGQTPYEYSSERTVETDDGDKFYVKAESVILAMRPLKVGNVVEVTAEVNHVWAGKAVVTNEPDDDTDTVIVRMLDGDRKDRLGGFAERELVFVAKELTPEWAVGDRVLVGDYAGKIAFIEENPCCGDDEVKVSLDGGMTKWVGFDDLESLDEREFVKAGYASVGDELILIDPLGDGFADIKVGEKVTVTNVHGSLDGDFALISATTADGRTTERYLTRFAHA